MRPTSVPSLSTRRGWLRASTLLPLAALSGCVVAPYGAHYRASTVQPGARERLAWCGGQVGPVTGLDLDLGGGLQLRASTGTDLEAGIPLRLLLTVPAGADLRFAGPVRVVAGERELPVAFSTAARRNWPLAPGEEVQTARLRPGSVARDAAQPQGELLLHLQTTAPAPARISVRGPGLAFAGEVVHLPPVDLARSARKPYLYVRGGPESVDENVAGSAAAVRWNGRWLYRPTHAEAELKLWPRDRRPFRLDTTSMQWRDAATGAVLPLRLTRAELWLEDAFDFRQGVGAAAVETRIALEASLPRGLPEFTLHWPDMTRDGRRVAVAPLRFQRRSLDGGVQPFNC